MGLLSDGFAHLLFVVRLQLLARHQVVVHLGLDMLVLVLEQLKIDCLVGFHVELFVVVFGGCLVFVVFLAEHLGHSLVIDVRNELSLKLLLDTLKQVSVFE